MIALHLATEQQRAWCQAVVKQYHYLHAPVDSRCSPAAYLIEHERSTLPVGCLIFGRPEATRCYTGSLTYGSLQDVRAGRAQFDRWEVLNLARVWLSPRVQVGGSLYDADLPGYTDRRGVWRSMLASWAIQEALGRIGYDYLTQRPPVFPDEPYAIKAALSYCDRAFHKGTIYRAAGFELARTNERQIETWYSTDVAPLTRYQDDMIRKLAYRSPRGIRLRAQRLGSAQSTMELV